MKKIFLLILLTVSIASIGQTKNLYDFKVKDINGKVFDFSNLKGKKVLIVNVASKCGLTPQYKQLEELFNKYKDQNFVIIGFPSDNFMGQEYDNDAEIKAFCSLNYGVTFPMMSRVDVKGKNKIPLFQWLTEKKLNGKLDCEIQWNFQKFMIDEDGNLVGFVQPKELPTTQTIIDWIENK